eukprot:scaffold170319_cov20-Prasinocladus_malaysianus.AAC.1
MAIESETNGTLCMATMFHGAGIHFGILKATLPSSSDMLPAAAMDDAALSFWITALSFVGTFKSIG